MKIKSLQIKRVLGAALVVLLLSMAGLPNVHAQGNVATGAINGLFSVSNHEQVYFSQGNLQQIMSAPTSYWKFADNQWDCFGPNGQYTSGSSNVDRDLFSWSGYNFDIISNAGNYPSLWRNLSKEECEYLLDGRVTASSMRFASARVNLLAGLVLFPDDWDSTLYLVNNVNQKNADYSSNAISVTDWQNVFEANGAVFLPAAGYQSGTNAVSSFGVSGSYWTTTRNGSSDAYSMGTNGVLGYGSNATRKSVRLVTSNALVVTTTEASDVTSTSAICGGTVTIEDDELSVFEYGICYNTKPFSTIYDMRVEHESGGLDGFSCSLSGLSSGITYYARAYVVSSQGVLYGDDVLFMTEGATVWNNGVLPGHFSINDTLQVQFSQGNLQYQASTNTWRFAGNQYDYVGADNANISATYEGWIDLFGWGTSGYNHGAVCYQPWSISTSPYDYYAYGQPANHLYSESGQADWGYNPISNGGNEEHLWRTMTREEWTYLMSSRVTPSQMYYVLARVNGVDGIIIFPDEWDASIITLTGVNNGSGSYSWNIISEQRWNTMEHYGAVFIPAAGRRNGSNWYAAYANDDVEHRVSIWSATGYSSYGHASVIFYPSTNHYSSLLGRDMGNSVRLVRSAVTFYSIEAVPNPAEGGSVTGAGVYEDGQTCSLMATANEGYTFVNWTQDGVEVSTNAAYSFTVTVPAAYVANFELNSYEITATANPEAGGTITGAGSYNHFETCTLTATANEGYTFVNWTKDGVEVSTNAAYSFTVAGPAAYVANFELNSYEITATSSPEAGGAITGAGTYNHFETCTLTATANEGYTFVNWTQDGEVVSTDAAYSFTVTGPAAFVANFELNSYEIAATANPEAGGIIVGAGYYYENNDCTLSALSNEGYLFRNWTENGEIVSTEASYSFVVESDRTLVANFEILTNHWAAESYQNSMFMIGVVTIDGIEQTSPVLELGAFCNGECRGTEFPAYDEGQWLYFMTIGGNAGDEITFRLYDHALQQELNLYCFNVLPFEVYGLIGIDESYEILFASTLSVSVVVNPENAGTIEGVGEYPLGAEATLTATANEGYGFNSWTLDGEVVSTVPSYTFTVTEPKSFTANFDVLYSVSINVNLEDAGTVMGEGEYLYGTIVTVTVTPNEGYAFNSWTLNGEVVSTEPSYTFTVTESVNFTANFDVLRSQQLIAGWNWWSTDLDITLNDLKAALVEALPGVNNIRIKSQDGGQTVWNGRFWNGLLKTLDVAQMYKISVPSDCEITLAGIPVNPAEHPVTIKNGANWMGFPLGQSMPINNALVGFPAVSGDQIKSTTNNTVYVRGAWRGALSTFEPGRGYIFKSVGVEDRTFTFPSSAK